MPQLNPRPADRWFCHITDASNFSITLGKSKLAPSASKSGYFLSFPITRM
jgi:hypothetical protein